ncbi:MAG: RDD family protein [Dehalococcoidia bacterium]
MSTELYCRNCGASLTTGSEYCGACGTSTSSGETLAQEVTQSLNIHVMRRRTGAIFLRLLVSGANSSLFGLISLFLFVIDLILMRNGQDWTARILGLRVVRSNGDIAGLAHMWTRLSVSVFSYLPFGLGFFWAYYDRYNQTLHDKLMGTYVVLDEPQLAERQRSSGSKAMFWSYFCVGFVVLMVLLIILSTVFL